MAIHAQSNVSESPAWNFREIQEGEPERMPRESEFFVGGDLDIPSSLVRETIQNSLDARRQTPVRIRFAFISRKLSQNNRFFTGLVEHVHSCGILNKEISGDDSVRLLVVEDFNTVGLTGNIRREGITEGTTSNYYNFWWREGIAQKQGTQGGRWGLGKITFHAVSKLHCFWGLTTRHDDGRTLLLGKTLLKPHPYDGKFFDYYGYFGTDGCRPVENKAVLDDFRQRFKITRTTEPGLSLVIPMVVEEIDTNSIIRSVIMHYFLPIAKGELIVEIGSEDTPPIMIDNSTLTEKAREQDWSGTLWQDKDIDSLLDFVESVKGLEGTGGMITLDSTGDRPRVSNSLFGESLESLQNNFRSGQLLGFKIPVEIKPVANSPKSSFFTVFVKKCDGIERADEFYWRSGILIANIRILGRQQVRTLLSADDEPVSRFLGDSETPAHAEWNERTQGFKDKYQDARPMLRFIRSAVRDIIRILDIPPAGRESDFLKEIFNVKHPSEERDRDRVIQPPPPPPPRPRHFDVSRIQGGVRISLSDSNVSLPIDAEVTMAYDVRRGNPFKRYLKWDFDLSKMNRKISGGKEFGISDNKVTLKVNKKNFSFQTKGFDPRRDVVVLIEER